MVTASTLVSLFFLHGPLCPNCMNISRVSIHDHCFVSMATRSSNLDELNPEVKI